MRSITVFAIVFALCYVATASRSDDEWDDDSNAKRMLSQVEASRFLETFKRVFGGKDEEIREDNDELGERRAEAFEAYEEKCEPIFHLGKRACAPMKECGANFQPNAFNNYNPTTSKPKKP